MITSIASVAIPALPRISQEEFRTKHPELISYPDIEIKIVSDFSPTHATRLLLEEPDPWDIEKCEWLGYSQAAWLVEHQDQPELAPFNEMLFKACFGFFAISVQAGMHFYRPVLVCRARRWAFEWHFGFHFSGYSALSIKQP